MKAQKEDCFLRGRQIAHFICEYFRGSLDPIHRELCRPITIVLRNDDIQEFDSKEDEILLSMTQITSADILEGLSKLRTRESEKLKIGLHKTEIHQKKAGSDSQ